MRAIAPEAVRVTRLPTTLTGDKFAKVPQANRGNPTDRETITPGATHRRCRPRKVKTVGAKVEALRVP
jgi:hypothetical protein